MPFIPRCLLCLAVSLLWAGCYPYKPRAAFESFDKPEAPDYRNPDHWAAHPAKLDPADSIPCGLPDLASADVDVFFLHPTILTGNRKGEAVWNANVNDVGLNRKTDASSILYQASAFNGAGRVFAPRYRQAHLQSFYTKKYQKDAEKALDLAYEDVRAAFAYYLKHHNNGRPFILAGHSQGGRHAMYLLRDTVETGPLRDRLVAAYLVGWPVDRDFFRALPPCETPEQTGCYCSWRTWERRFGRKHASETGVVCTNPLLWTTEEGVYAGKAMNRGGVLRDFCEVYPELADAEVYKGILLCSKPKFPGSILFNRKNYHIGDLNLYYVNVRENAAGRAAAFEKK